MGRIGGAVAGVAALGTTACDDGSADEESPPLDAAPPEPDAALPDAEVPDAAPPPPDLEPLRGDGSHPFDFIDTLVIVQMENRSFDHYFGALTLLEGREDVDGLTEGMANPGPDGPVGVYPLGDHFVTDPDPPHGHGASVAQYNEGANDGFVREYRGGADVMGYYTRDQLPVSYGLADAFTLCQRWHCALLGPTWPNRFFSHCAESGGLLSNSGFIDAPTLYPALEEKGLTWGNYFHNLFFTATILSIRDHHARKHDAFYEDAAAGTLPNVTIVEPAFFVQDDHPPADVRMGQAFLGTVYEALRQSPQWDRCLMVVFYDEHGGFFDHVPPPEAVGDARAADGFDRLGFRIPGLLAGPLVKRGHVLDTVVEHCSVPRLIADVFGLDHLNERAASAGDLGEALDLAYVNGADRPPAPAMPVAPVPMQALERGLRAESGQPELERWMREMGFAHHDSLPERRRLMRRWIEEARRLKTVKFVR